LAEHVTPHDGLTEYLLDSLSARERERFEEHLLGCGLCREHVAELRGIAGLLARAVPGYDVPPGLEGRTFAAVEHAAAAPAAATEPAPRPRRQWAWRRRLVLAGAAAAVLAAAVFAGTRLDGSGPGGRVELSAVLAAPDGGAERATASVTKTGIGRVVAFRTDDLPILPKGEYYELWFVGPGDTLARPNRISAGTFHPDEQGRSDVELTAAVDPAKYPVLSVTAEPGDGNPRRTGPEVLRSGG
jgi:anti-sigma-K factor RskA